MAVKYNYNFKPTTASYFKKAPLSGGDTVKKSLTSQTENLEKRFEQQNISLQGEGEIDQRGLIEKALNLGADQGMLMNVLEVMDRPRQVVANVISSLGSEDDRNVLEAAWEGLSGQKKLSSKEAIQKLTGVDNLLEFEDQGAGLDMADVGNFVVDLGLDMLTDPTTYVGWGWLTSPIKSGTVNGARMASKLARASRIYGEGTVKLAGEAVGAVQKVATKVGDLFNATKYLSPEMIEAIKKIDAKAGRIADNLRGRLSGIKKKLVATGVENAESILTEVIENQGRVIMENGVAKLSYGARKIVVADTLDTLLDTMKQSGTGQHILPRMGTRGADAIQDLETTLYRLNELVPPSKRPAFRLSRRPATDGGENVILEFLDSDPNVLSNAIEAAKLEAQSNARHVYNNIIELGNGIPSQVANDFALKHGDVLTDTLGQARGIRKHAKKLLSSFNTYKVGDDVSETGFEYMRHTRSNAAKQYAKDNAAHAKGYFKSAGTDQFVERSYEGTAQEINAALKDVYDMKDDLFDESAITSLDELITQAQRQYNQQEVTSLVLGVQKVNGSWYKNPKAQPNLFMDVPNNAGFIQKNLPNGYVAFKNGTFQKEFSNLYKNMPAEMQEVLSKLLDRAGSTADGVSDVVAMNKSAYNVMKNIDRAYREVPAIAKMYDKVMVAWKATNLLSPAFHVRNAIGNSTNMYLAGMNLPQQLKFQGKAWTQLGQYRKLMKVVNEKGIAALSDADKLFMNTVEQFLNSGASQIVKGGARDLDDIAKLTSKKTSSKVAGVVQEVVDTNFKIAEQMDDVQRYAMWMWSMEKYANDPKATTKALMDVRNALFDYSNLTPFERDYMKRLIPFYTFMKNNLVFQASNIMENTGQYVKLLRSYDTWNEDIGGIKTEDMPDYMSGNMWLPIPMSFGADDAETISFLKLNLPPADFLEFIENPLKKGVTSVTIPIKLAWELGTNTDSFTGAPLREFEGEERSMDADAGVLSDIRGAKGEFRLSEDPVMQKIADELGLRNPRKVANALLDILDTAAGKTEPKDLLAALLEETGISDTKDKSEIDLTQLYQYLEYLRNQKKLYEQETGQKLEGVRRKESIYAKIA